MKFQTIANFPISIGPYSAFLEEIITLASKKKSCYVCIAAVHQLIESFRNPSFANVAYGADIVTPDGMPITWGLRFLYRIKQDRVAGPDILPDILKKAENQNLSVYFYGSTNPTLEKTSSYLKANYPNLKIAGTYSPPFRILSNAEEAQTIDHINSSQANIVFVVLGCPKQERWMAEMKNKINATMIGIGAALPVMVGIHRRAPMWMQRAGLEWLFRLIQEPKRLWKRYFITNSFFIALILYERIKLFLPRYQKNKKSSNIKLNGQ